MKRSSQVALLLMGATGVGAASYAATPPRQCVADPAAVSSPDAVKKLQDSAAKFSEPCPPGTRSAGSGFWTRTNSNNHWSRPRFSRTTTTATPSSKPSFVPGATPTSRTAPPSAPRGGFGTTGRSSPSAS